MNSFVNSFLDELVAMYRGPYYRLQRRLHKWPVDATGCGQGSKINKLSVKINKIKFNK